MAVHAPRDKPYSSPFDSRFPMPMLPISQLSTPKLEAGRLLLSKRVETMPTLQGHTRTAFLCFFISHIPITILLDGQAFFPRHLYPQVARDVLDWYAITFKVCF